MKTIIEGKRYDTEKADLVAEWSNQYPATDFKHCEESLYRTKKGAFFLHGVGGAMSRYREACGDMYGGGEAIAPLSDTEAREWLERTENFDELEELFAAELEDA